MKQIRFPIELKGVHHSRSYILQKVYTNDKDSVDIVFELLDTTGTELAGATASIMLYMLDGSFYQDSATISGTEVIYTLTEAQGNHAGIAQAQIVVSIGGKDYASSKEKFEIINGLETAVAVEIMIKDWTMLTAEARAFIDEAEANEAARVAAEQDRVSAEAARLTAEQGRITAELGRITSEEARVTGYAQMDARITDQSKTVQDLDSGKNYSAVLEVLDGQPRLKITEAI